MPGEVLWASWHPDLSVGSAVRLPLTPALRSSVGAVAQGTTADRNEVPGLAPPTASLSFLGVGVPPPQPAWGLMLSDGKQSLMVGRWWLSVLPGCCIMLMVLIG
jgi:hypothetical protein